MLQKVFIHNPFLTNEKNVFCYFDSPIFGYYFKESGILLKCEKLPKLLKLFVIFKTIRPTATTFQSNVYSTLLLRISISVMLYKALSIIHSFRIKKTSFTISIPRFWVIISRVRVPLKCQKLPKLLKIVILKNY